jgi:type 1 fimbria pilin
MKIPSLIRQGLLVGILLGLTFPTLAGLLADVTVKVTLVKAAGCELNDNQPIVVDFGEVKISQINGVNHTKVVQYTLTCESGAEKAMKLMIDGNSASFNGDLLATNKTGLAIEIRKEGQALPVNSWVNFTYPDTPTLSVTLIKQSGATLEAGKFSAGATLMMDFQ